MQSKPSDVTPEQRLDAALQRQREPRETYEDVLAAWKLGELSESHLVVAELDANAAYRESATAYAALHPDQQWEMFCGWLDERERILVRRLRELSKPAPIRPVVVTLPVYRHRRPAPRRRGAGRPRGHTGGRRTCARSGDPDPDLAPELSELVRRYAKRAGIPPERVLACAGCGVVAVCIDRYQADQLRALGWTAAWCPACWKRLEAKP